MRRGRLLAELFRQHQFSRRVRRPAATKTAFASHAAVVPDGSPQVTLTSLVPLDEAVKPLQQNCTYQFNCSHLRHELRVRPMGVSLEPQGEMSSRLWS